MPDSVGFVAPTARAPPELGRGSALLRRGLKSAVALALVGAGLYAMFAEQGVITTDNAVVSAYTVALRAPMTGFVSGLRAAIGDPVAAGAVIAHLAAPLVDDQHLVDLDHQLARIRGDRRAYQQQQAELSAQLAAFRDRAAERTRFETAYLSLQAAEADRQLHQQEAAQDYARRELDRKTALGRTGDAPAVDIDRAHSLAEQAELTVQAAIARHAYLQLQAEVAGRGILLESGSADAPYSSQRADELAIRLAEIAREIASLTAAEAEASGREEAERARLDRLRAVDVTAPSPGMVWKLGASEGERVAAGDTLAELVACDAAFILAVIPQDRVPDVRIGSTARVRLAGETAERQGRVVSLSGDARMANDRNLAASPPVQIPASAMARIALTPGATDCVVGRTARVLLPSATEHPWLAALLRRMF